MEESAEHDALERLAECYGIFVRFENAFGREVAVNPQTIKMLLESMGVSASNDAEVQSALNEFKQRTARIPMPTTVVVIPIEGTCVMHLKRDQLPHPLEWQVMLETGDERAGSFIWRDTSQEHVALRLDGLPFGYHRLRLPQLDFEANLIVTPGRCWLPESSEGGVPGIALQLYLVRSAKNWGIGDFSDLRTLVELAGPRGCGVIGVNPLHQMFIDDPEAASPYSPATRLYLNPLYIDVMAIAEAATSAALLDLVKSLAFRQRLEQCRAADLVDYAGVTALKLEALRLVHHVFHDEGTRERKAAFEAFRAERGQSLERASLFQVVRQHLSQISSQHRDWREWPAQFQAVGSKALEQFALEHRGEIDFQNWLQFIADEQLATVADAAHKQGMAVGLYRDLAVGCDASGAETWADFPAFLQGSLVGAPPDIFNPAGQNWGLPPFDPVALERGGYRSFAELIRANMRHAGGLRIDHVMGLYRLFCIPEGKAASEGAYVRFPLEDLIGVLALESHRNRCLIVGEDLGTVPPGFREEMAAANILSYRVLFFEQNYSTGSFLAPEMYPKLALATTGSHDLPTLLAWWQGKDLVIKDKLGLFPSPEEIASQKERRDREQRNILKAFAQAGLIDEAHNPEAISPDQFARLAHRYLALTPSLLLATQLDDMTGELDPVNIPGTHMEHANWRRKYQLSLEEIAADANAWEMLATLT